MKRRSRRGSNLVVAGALAVGLLAGAWRAPSAPGRAVGLLAGAWQAPSAPGRAVGLLAGSWQAPSAPGRAVGAPEGVRQAPSAGGWQLVFADESAPGAWDLVRASPDGHGRVRLTNTPGLQEHAPAVSPDGAWVAFVGSAPGPDEETISAIFVIPATGGTPVQVSSGPTDGSPSWDPTGLRVVYATQLPGQSSIVSRRSDGTEPQVLAQLDSDSESLESPAVSPDGRTVVFVLRSAGAGQLWRMNADGSGLAPLLAHPGWDDIDPAWSPDGRSLVFASGPEGGAHGLWRTDMAGALGVILAGDGGDVLAPDWSEEGIAFERRVAGSAGGRIEILPGLGTSSEFVTSGSGPSWLRGAEEPGPSPGPGTTEPGPSPTPTGAVGTPTPPAPTFPPPPPTPRPFPTRSVPGATSTGPGPTYPLPTATGTPSPTTIPSSTPSASATPKTAWRAYLPACDDGPPMEPSGSVPVSQGRGTQTETPPSTRAVP